MDYAARPGTGDDHLVINAKAGSGKSTVAVESADRVYTQHGLHTLYITFSTQLKMKERASAKESNRNHIQVESFHSTVANVFGFPCNDQHTLEMFLRDTDAEPIDDLSTVGLLVIDEAQDLTQSYVCLVQRLRKFVHVHHRLMLVGDRFQNVFQSLQASSPEYIDSPSVYFGGVFTRMHMSTSFRITPEMADWINSRVNPLSVKRHYPETWEREGEHITASWGTGIHASPTRDRGEGVVHVTFDFYKHPLPTTLVDTVDRYIRLHGVESVLILTDSAYPGATHAVTRLLNRFEEHPWIILNSEFPEEASVMKGKGVVATPYKMKGREQRLVVFFGFDSRLERWTDRPRPMLAYALAYVACTRACDKLVVASHTTRPLFTDTPVVRAPPRRVCRSTTTTSLSRFIPFDHDLDDIRMVTRATCETGMEDPSPTFASGRVGVTMEPVDKWYALAVRESLPLVLDDAEARIDWVAKVQSLLQVHSSRTGLSFAERQLSECSTWVDSELLDRVTRACADMVFQFFSEFTQSCYNERELFLHRVKGTAFLVFDDTHLVHYCFAPTTDLQHAQEALLSASLLGASGAGVYILNARAGELKQVYVPPTVSTTRQYLESVLHRKHLSGLLG